MLFRSGDGMGPAVTNGRKAAKNVLDDIAAREEESEDEAVGKAPDGNAAGNGPDGESAGMARFGIAALKKAAGAVAGSGKEAK